jgi:hypothetical protein
VPPVSGNNGDTQTITAHEATIRDLRQCLRGSPVDPPLLLRHLPGEVASFFTFAVLIGTATRSTGAPAYTTAPKTRLMLRVSRLTIKGRFR